MYWRDMGVWMELCHTSELSEIQGSDTELKMGVCESMPLQQVQHSAAFGTDTTAQTLANLRDRNTRSTTLSFLESQISRSHGLQSPFEYQHWTKAYVKYLVKEGMEQRLRKFCMKFCWSVPGMVLGFRNQALLKEFLAVIAGNAKLQRLYCELCDAFESREYIGMMCCLLTSNFLTRRKGSMSKGYWRSSMSPRQLFYHALEVLGTLHHPLTNA